METLTHLFDWLLAASARASLLTVAVLILQSLLRHRVPARWRYALWLPVLVVLLTPAFPESPWSVGSIIHATPAPLPVPVMMEQGPALTAAAPDVATSELPASISWPRMMRQTWLIGAAGLLLCCLGAYLRTLWRFQRSRVPASDTLLNEVATLVREIGLRRAPLVWMASAIPSPAVTGLLRPTLLLPAQFEETLTAQEVRLVLRHELTHIKRGDLPLNALLCLLLALHWFNPLLWLAFFKVRLDREAACDAQVLDREQQPQRVAYGHTLLKVESAFSHHGLSLGFVGIFQHGIALRSRIQSIATQPAQHPLMKTMLSFSIALLTFLGITKAAPPDNDTPQVVIEAKFLEVGDDAKDLLTSPSLVGVLNEEQLGDFWKKIEAAKGVDVLATPQVTTRSGQKATIEIVREFAYKDADGKPATKNLGITLALLPLMTGENEIDLDISPQIVEIEGMVKDPNSGVEQPVFNERKVTSRVKMISGQTVVLGMGSTSETQTTEDRSAGRVTTKTENVTRHTMVFVTARLMDPAGNPVEAKPAAVKSPLQAKLDAIVIPGMQFQDATLTEAVEYLRRKSQELDAATTDPNQKGVNILIKTGGNTPEAKITLNLKNIPLGEALKYIAQISNLQLVVEQNGVLLLSEAEFEARQKQAESSASTRPGMVITADSISLDKASGSVTASGGVEIDTPQGTITTKDAQIDTKPSASKIILPKVHFHEASLTEAVEFLRIKTRDLDPGKRGLNILVKPGGDPKARITLQLNDVPALEALRFCAELTGHTLSVEGDVLVITPAEAALCFREREETERAK